MKFTKTSFKRAMLPTVAALMLSTAGTQAAIIDSYVLQVEGGLNAVDFFGHTGTTSFTDVAGLSVHGGAAWIADLGATTGTIQVDIHDTGDVSYADCSGFLSTMCNGSYNFAQGLSLGASDGYSFQTHLGANGLTYVDDASYAWDYGNQSFFQVGYGVEVTYNVTAASVSAVPLPASMAFLMGGFGLLLGFRKRSDS